MFRKSSVPLLVLGLALAQTGCAGWEKRAKVTIGLTEYAARSAFHVARPVFKRKCRAAAETCKGEVCKALKECQGQRRKFYAALIMLHQALNAASVALELKQEGLTAGAIARVAALIESIRKAWPELWPKS